MERKGLALARTITGLILAAAGLAWLIFLGCRAWSQVAAPATAGVEEVAAPAPGGAFCPACCRADVASSAEAPDTAAVVANADPVFGDFLGWVRQHAQTGAKIPPVELKRGVELAQRRRVLLANLIQTDPKTALAVSIPADLAKKLPAAVAAQLETQVSARGNFTVTATDYRGGEQAPEITRSVTIAGQTYPAFVYGKRADRTSKYNLPMNGIVLNGRMAVDENPVRVLPPEEVAQLDPNTKLTNVNNACPVMPARKVPGLAASCQAGRAATLPGASDSGSTTESGSSVSSTLGTTPPAAPAPAPAPVVEVGGEYTQLCCPQCCIMLNQQLTAASGGSGPSSGDGVMQAASAGWTTGNKTVLVIPADFTDTPNTTSFATYQTYMDTVVNPFYVSDSYGLTSLTTTVMTQVVHLSHNAAYYAANGGAPIAEGKALALAAGWNTANYNLFVVAAPSEGGLGGVGNVGAAGVVCYNDLGAAAHEIGHNFGVMHANRWTTSDGSVLGPGKNQEYGNLFSVMGGAETATPSDHDAWMKNDLGWLPAGNIATVTTSGTYTLNALDDGSITGANKYALKMNNPTHGNNYWIEARDQQTTNSWAMDGVMVLWSPWGTTGNPSTTSGSNWGTQILHMAPNTQYGILNMPLLVGRTFCDRVNGYYVTPISRSGSNPSQTQVVINIGAFPGNRPPTLTITPTASSVSQGTVVNFTATASDPDGDTLAYAWDFGDKSFGADSPTASHSWAADGQYVVQCTVSDMKGGEAIATAVITVGAPATFTISGAVTTAGGQGVGGVSVYYYIKPNPNVTMVLKSTTSDSNGVYHLVGFAAGSYNIGAAKGNWTFTPTFTNPVTVGPDATNINFTAAPITHAITGTVLDGSSTPVAGVTISNGTDTATTDGSGNYTLNLQDGLYIVTPSKAGYSFAPASLTVTLNAADMSSENFTATVIGDLAPVIDSPASASPNPVVNRSTTSVSVTAHDPDAGPAPLTYTWTKISGPGVVTFAPNGTNGADAATATFSASGTYTLQVSVSDSVDVVTSQIVGLNVTLPNQPPTVATAPAATPNPVTGTTTALSVLGADDGGEPALVYTWSSVGPAGVTFNVNGTNASK
ncbi:MAG: PKD domain-containing protein, partial [Planctomycetota bacterium]